MSSCDGWVSVLKARHTENMPNWWPSWLSVLKARLTENMPRPGIRGTSMMIIVMPHPLTMRFRSYIGSFSNKFTDDVTSLAPSSSKSTKHNQASEIKFKTCTVKGSRSYIGSFSNKFIDCVVHHWHHLLRAQNIIIRNQKSNFKRARFKRQILTGQMALELKKHGTYYPLQPRKVREDQPAVEVRKQNKNGFAGCLLLKI